MIKTDPNFWDCECKGNDYIHPKSQKRCKKCGARAADQPDSRVNEIEAALKKGRACKMIKRKLKDALTRAEQAYDDAKAEQDREMER